MSFGTALSGDTGKRIAFLAAVSTVDDPIAITRGLPRGIVLYHLAVRVVTVI